MFVNKFQINISTIDSGTTATTINIPISLEYQIVDNSELIDRVFVTNEIQKAINPIADYEKVRFLPLDLNNKNIDTITYSLTFLTGTKYSDIGFDDDDIRFAKNSFKESFLKLAFYDTPNPLNQRLISNISLYPHLLESDLYDNTVVFPNIPGQPKPANQIKVSFILSNPVTSPRGNAEGYYLYNYKDEIFNNIPKELYMRASFNNAKTGKSVNLMVDSTPHSIDVLVGKLYTKYILTRSSTGFYYKIDKTYNSNGTIVPNNVTYSSNNVTIKLYQIQVL